MSYKYHQEVANEPMAYRVAYAALANLGRLSDYPFVSDQLDIEGFRLRKTATPSIDWLSSIILKARAHV